MIEEDAVRMKRAQKSRMWVEKCGTCFLARLRLWANELDSVPTDHYKRLSALRARMAHVGAMGGHPWGTVGAHALSVWRREPMDFKHLSAYPQMDRGLVVRPEKRPTADPTHLQLLEDGLQWRDVRRQK